MQGSHWKHLTKKKKSASDQQAFTAPSHGLQKFALIFLQVFLSPWTATIGGPLLSGVKDYSHFSYRIKSRTMVLWNSKDLFAWRKMTEAFISGTQQTVPFSLSNGPSGQHERNRFSERSAHCPGAGGPGGVCPLQSLSWLPGTSHYKKIFFVICYVIIVSICVLNHIKWFEFWLLPKTEILSS